MIEENIRTVSMTEQAEGLFISLSTNDANCDKGSTKNYS